MFENPRRGRQVRNFTTNVPKILDLKSSSEQIFSENCRWVPLSLGRPKGGCMWPHNRGGHLNRGLISYSSLQFRTWITCHFICDCLMMVQLYLHLLLCNIHDCKLWLISFRLSFPFSLATSFPGFSPTRPYEARETGRRENPERGCFSS